MSSVNAPTGFSFTPRPEPQAPPRPPLAAPTTVGLSADRIARPQAQASPASLDRHPPDATAALPILAAAGLIAGGVVLAGPALAAGGAEVGVAASALGARASAASSFVQTAAREAATRYHTAAEHVAKLDYRDPHVVGAAVGNQAWTSSEELVRGALVGLGFAGGTWAAKSAGNAIHAALGALGPHERAH
jgi:hypothetical protein